MGAFAVAALAWAIFGRPALALRPLDAMLAFLALIPLVYVLSGFGGPSLNPYGFDATGRYAPPIWSGLSVVGGTALGALWQARRLLAIAFALIPLTSSLLGALSVDPLAAFQSPYWDRLPASNAQLLQMLRDARVEYVWMNHWAGQPAMFDARIAGQKLVAYDWYDVQAGGIDRFPEFLPHVEGAARPGYVLVTDEPQPALEQSLASMGVSFEEHRAWPYVLVVPLSRVVHPSEVTPAVDYRY
jgi:hypothetical protein